LAKVGLKAEDAKEAIRRGTHAVAYGDYGFKEVGGEVQKTSEC
jgi:hypothetical protein